MASQLALRPSSALTSAGPSKVPSKAVPAFLHKLYNMVDDPSTDSLIKWTENGDSFIVLDHEQFARSVLGRWFKHQNFASFVRQLNMYGFHKVPHLQQGVLRTESDSEVVNFENPNFKRGQPDLLCLIQRKKQLPTSGGLGHDFALMDGDYPSELKDSGAFPHKASSSTVVDVNSIVNGITSIKRHQAAISSELKALQQSNQHLWQEAIAARERHKKNEDTINRILKFLAGVFGSAPGGNAGDPQGARRPASVVPVKSTRLMIEDRHATKPHIWSADDLPNVLDELTPLEALDSPSSSDRFSLVDTPLEQSSVPMQDASANQPAIPPDSSLNSAPTQSISSISNPPQTSAAGYDGSINSKGNDALMESIDSASLMRQAENPPINPEPYISDAILQLLNNTDDFQRLLENFPSFPLEDNQTALLDNREVIPREDHLTMAPFTMANELRNLTDGGADINSRVNAVQTDIDSIIQSIGLNPNDLQFDMDNYPVLGDESASTSADAHPAGLADFEFTPYLEDLTLLPGSSPAAEIDSNSSIEPVAEEPLLQEVTNTPPASPQKLNGDTRKRKSASPFSVAPSQTAIKRRKK